MNSLALIMALLMAASFSPEKECYQMECKTESALNQNQEPYAPNEVALVVITGQSNAELDLDPATFAFTGPAPNVYVMGTNSYTFKPYNTSDNQVFRSVRSNTHNVGTELARAWQNRINTGEQLPDLYIIQVALSGNGFFQDQWTDDPSRYGFIDPVEGGPHSVAQTSLYRLAQDSIKAGIEDVEGLGKNPRLLYGQLIGLEHETQKWAWARKYNVMLEAMKSLIQTSTNTSGINFIYTYPQTGDWSSGKRVNINPYWHVRTAQISILQNYRPVNPEDIEIDIEDSGVMNPLIDNVHYEPIVTTWIVEESLRRTIDAGLYGELATTF